MGALTWPSRLVVGGILFWRWKSTDRGAERLDSHHLEDADAGGHLVEVSGGEFLPHAFDFAGGRSAAGARRLKPPGRP